MPVYGYCRISTLQQNIERQVRNIAAAYPAAHIVRRSTPARPAADGRSWTSCCTLYSPGIPSCLTVFPA